MMFRGGSEDVFKENVNLARVHDKALVVEE